MSESAARARVAQRTPIGLRRQDSIVTSEEQSTALDRSWVARRQEVFQALDATIQQAMGTVLETTSEVLRTAQELHEEMEREARLVLDRLEQDRGRLVEQIGDHRRTRDRLLSELRDVERRAEDEASRVRDAAHDESMRITRGAHEDAGRIRRTANEEAARALRQAQDEAAELIATAQAQAATLLRDAEERRTRLLAEIRQIEHAFGSATGRLQTLLDPSHPAEEAQTSARPSIEPTLLETARSQRPESEGEERPAPTPIPMRRESEPRATIRPTEVVREEVEHQDHRERSRWGGHAAQPSTVELDVPDSTVPHVPESAVATSSTHAEEALTAAPTSLRLAISNTPTLGRALEVQRAIQRTEGVRDVRALQFEHGVLVLNVEHQLGADILARICSLPNLGLESVRSDGATAELRFPA
jgi:cell division septum initiation protein DivIVA